MAENHDVDDTAVIETLEQAVHEAAPPKWYERRPGLRHQPRHKKLVRRSKPLSSWRMMLAYLGVIAFASYVIWSQSTWTFQSESGWFSCRSSS